MHVNPAGGDWAPQTPEERVLHAFMRIGRRMKAGQQHQPIDHSMIAALHTLRCSAGALRLTELANQIELDASTASRLVRTLESEGLVARTPDPDDRRASRVELTDAGLKRLEEFSQRRQEILTAAMSGWKKSDIETFATLMGRFADGVNQTAEERNNPRGTETSDKENR
jgi:DNA-binding MarR family transcriptional regulator